MQEVCLIATIFAYIVVGNIISEEYIVINEVDYAGHAGSICND